MNTAALLVALLLCPGPSRAGEVRRVVPLKSGGLVKSAPFSPGNRTGLVPPLRLEVNPRVHTSIQPSWRSGAPVELDAPRIVPDPAVEVSAAVVPFTAQTAVPQGEEGRKRLIDTLGEKMEDPSRLSGDGARKDFEKRAQLDGETGVRVGPLWEASDAIWTGLEIADKKELLPLLHGMLRLEVSGKASGRGLERLAALIGLMLTGKRASTGDFRRSKGTLLDGAVILGAGAFEKAVTARVESSFVYGKAAFKGARKVQLIDSVVYGGGAFVGADGEVRGSIIVGRNALSEADGLRLVDTFVVDGSSIRFVKDGVVRTVVSPFQRGLRSEPLTHISGVSEEVAPMPDARFAALLETLRAPEKEVPPVVVRGEAENLPEGRGLAARWSRFLAAHSPNWAVRYLIEGSVGLGAGWLLTPALAAAVAASFPGSFAFGLLAGFVIGGFFLHELGHYLLSKLSGADVRWEWEKDFPWQVGTAAFRGGTTRQRLMHLLGGPLMNMALGLLVFAVPFVSGAPGAILLGFSLVNLAGAIGALLPIDIKSAGGLMLSLVLKLRAAKKGLPVAALALLLFPRPGGAGTVEVRRVNFKSGGAVKSAPWASGNRTSLVPPLRLEVNPRVHTSIQPSWRSGAPVELDAPRIARDPAVEGTAALVPFAAQTVVPRGEEGRKLIETLAEKLPDPGTLTSDEAREDFQARAQLGTEIPRSGRDVVSGSAPGWGAGFLRRFKRAEQVAFTPSLPKPGGYYYHGTSWKDVLAIALGSSGKMTPGVSYFSRGASQAEPFGESRARKQDSKAVLLEFEGELVEPLVEAAGAPAGLAFLAKAEVPLSALTDASKQALIAEFDARGDPAERARFMAALGVQAETGGAYAGASGLVSSLLDAKTLAGIRENLKERLPVHEGGFTDERIRVFVADSLAPYLAWRAKALGLGGADAYAASLPPAGGEVQALRAQLGLLTGYYGESYSDFFRESSAWLKPLEGYFERLISARLASGSRTIRVKSLGAGTGQEPYSIAIVLERALRKAGQDSSRWEVVIEAVDVNAVSLWAAKEGLFAQRILAQIPDSEAVPTAELVERPRPGIARMNARLRSWVKPVFINLNEPAQHEILEQTPADVIFAKNMLMHLKLLPSQLLAERLLQGGWGRSDAAAFLNMDVLVTELTPPGKLSTAESASLGNADPVTFLVGFSQAREEVVFFTDKLWNRLTSRTRTPLRDFFRAVAAAWSWVRLGLAREGRVLYGELKGYQRRLQENPGHEETLDAALVDLVESRVGAFELLNDPRPYAYDANTRRFAINAALLMSGSALKREERLAVLSRLLARARAARSPGGAKPSFFHPGLGSGRLMARGITDDGAVLKAVRFEGGDRLVWLAAARYTPFYGLRRE